MERFHSLGHELCKFIGKKRKILHRKRFQLPQNLVWDTNMATVKLFWGINMVDVTSREKGIYVYNAGKSRFVHEVSYSSQ